MVPGPDEAGSPPAPSFPGAGNWTPADTERIARRLGRDALARRLRIEGDAAAQIAGRRPAFLTAERMHRLHGLLRCALKLSGFYRPGRRNAEAPRAESHGFVLPRLPPAFDGFRILHLSDPHFDMSPAIENAIIEAVTPLDYDLCVITGDFRSKTFGPTEETVRAMRRVRAALRGPVWAVLGNHDPISLVPPFEAMGVGVLLNETVEMARGSDRIDVSGVDDAHCFRTADLDRALAGRPPGRFRILLSHSPDIFRAASGRAVDLMLCGHTHGGQWCLPGGRPLLRNARCPPALLRGPWKAERMDGYTSPGAGCSGVEVRFFCSPSIPVHTLRRG